MSESEYRHVTYETLDDGTIARIMLDRPEMRNAQHRSMLVELNEAFLRAEADDTVRVVILCGAGPLFSSEVGRRDTRNHRWRNVCVRMPQCQRSGRD